MASADRVGPVLGRLHALHPRLIDLSLERPLGLLAKLDHPERCLPPVSMSPAPMAREVAALSCARSARRAGCACMFIPVRI